MTFEELGLSEKLLEALTYMNFVEATPIQEEAIPAILNDKDLLACAQTGTGKTAAFILPVLNKAAERSDHSTTDTLVIVPTRELALQIDQQIQAFSYFVAASSYPIYGGGDGLEFEQQKSALVQGTEIIVATPGKLISHINMGNARFNNIRHLILDEADRMLDMGFFEDIQKIASHLPKERQTLMFSATMPPKIRQLAKKILRGNPVEISLAISKPAAGVLQAAYLASNHQKNGLITKLIKEKPNYTSIIIFTSTKRKVNDIVRALKGADYAVEAISSDLVQKDREEALLRFRSKRTRVLVATDVLARGIDIKDINLVINYDVPNDAEDYVHRVGRTARADTTGVALTLINEEDMYKFRRIEELIEQEVAKIPLPKELGEGPTWDPNARPPRNPRGGRGRGGGGGRRGKGGRRSSGSSRSGNKNRRRR